MATVVAQSIAAAGLIPAYAAVNAADKALQPTDQRLFLHVKNGGGGSINVTIPAQQAAVDHPSGGRITLPDIVVAVGNGAEKMIGPFPPGYVDADGYVNFEYSGTTSVTAGVFRLPRLG